MLFRSRKGNTTVISIDDMLSYRNTWKEKPAPDFDFSELLKEARTVKAPPTIAALPTSDNGYRVVDASKLEEGQKTIRAVQSTLNKLTEKNYDELSQKVLGLTMLDTDVIMQVVARIYEKALDEPAFSKLYALLCHDIIKHSFECPNVAKIDGDTLRKEIVSRTQITFEEMSEEGAANMDEQEVAKLRKRKLANIKFVAELYNRTLLKEKIMVIIINSIFNTKEENPPPPSAIDAEVGLEFLTVVGKELEKKLPLVRVWEVVRMHMRSGAFGTRLTFLYQNLVELKDAGWVGKDEPSTQQEPAPPPPPQLPRKVDDRSPMLPTASSSSTLDAGGKSAASDQKKAVALARPPDGFDERQMRKVCSLIRDTLLDGKWENTKNDFSTMVATEPPHVSRMACLYGLTTQICTTARDVDRKDLIVGLTNSAWEPSEVSRGVAWALTEGIANRMVEDCPKYYERFVALAAEHLAASHIPILTAVKDVFARTSNYLDVLYVPLEGCPSWDLDFINVWEAYLKRCVELGKDIPPIAGVLDSLGSVRQTTFMQGILPDFVQAMISANLCDKDEIEQWRQKQESNPKVTELVHQLATMILC